MFTGIVEERGTLVRVAAHAKGTRFEVRAAFAAKPGEIAIGDSVAVNGCCLTVVSIADGCLGFDLLEETQRVTNLRALAPGGVVDLERSLRYDGRIGGHFVSGHVDCTGDVLVLEPRGADVYLRVKVPEKFRHYLVPKGSIAVDGISLTVAEVHPDGFAVWLIPHTLSITTLGVYQAGAIVNLEFDMLAKLVERILEGKRDVSATGYQPAGS
jgi:riboflavin synthase